MTLVKGFDYVTGKEVAMTPKQWREKYPAHAYRRATVSTKDGPETWYRASPTRVISAEAYAIIPAGRQA